MCDKSQIKEYKPDEIILHREMVDDAGVIRTKLLDSVHGLRENGSTHESLHVNNLDRQRLINCILKDMGECRFSMAEDPTKVESIYGINIIVVPGVPEGEMFLVAQEWYTYLDTRFIRKITIV